MKCSIEIKVDSESPIVGMLVDTRIIIPMDTLEKIYIILLNDAVKKNLKYESENLLLDETKINSYVQTDKENRKN